MFCSGLAGRTRLYVANQASSTVSVINTMTDMVVDTIATTSTPRAVAVNPADTRLFVSGFDKVQMVDTATDTASATIQVRQLITSIAVRPDGARAYVLNNGTGTISVIDTATATVSATWNIFGSALALSPDGAHLYVAGGGLDVVDTATGSVTATVVTGQVNAIALNPAGTTASVTITGSGFTGAGAVSFGSTPASSFTVNSDTSITATAPAGTGTVDVTVTTASGTRATSSADQYTYIPAPVITGISPTHGPEAGATSVTITGSGFTGASAVAFGTVAASSFAVNSDTQITATAPAGSALGPVDVTVATPAGTSAVTAANNCSYVNTVAKATADGRIDVGGHDANISFTARRTTPGGPIKGNLTYNNHDAGVKIKQAVITVFYQSGPNTAHAEAPPNAPSAQPPAPVRSASPSPTTATTATANPTWTPSP